MTVAWPRDPSASPRPDLHRRARAGSRSAALVVVLSWQMDRIDAARRDSAHGAGSVARHRRPRACRCWRRARAALVAARAAHRLGRAPSPTTRRLAPTSSFALAAALFFVYALLLVGRGLPFWLGTTLFVTAFVFLFQHARAQGATRRGRTAARSSRSSCGVAHRRWSSRSCSSSCSSCGCRNAHRTASDVRRPRSRSVIRSGASSIRCRSGSSCCRRSSASSSARCRASPRRWASR